MVCPGHLSPFHVSPGHPKLLLDLRCERADVIEIEFA